MKLTPYLESFGITQEELDWMVEHEGFTCEPGGWELVNNNRDSDYYEVRRQNGHQTIGQLIEWCKNNPEHNKRMFEVRKRTIEKVREQHPTPFKGKTHTDETKKQISLSMEDKQSGRRNSQYGTMWITDDIVSKKISKTDPIPDGWRRGRIIK